MPWIENISNPQELQRCIRDLVVLSTLAATWTNCAPQQIVDSLASSLVSMLDADFVYILLPEERDRPLIEVTHPGKRILSYPLGAIRDTLRRDLNRRSELTFIANPIGDGKLRVAMAPIGFGGDAILVAGSEQQSGFPTEVQRLLLRIAASNATVALQHWQAEADERRFVSLVERSSDFIGFASLDGRPQYLNPAGFALVGLSQLDRNVHVLDFIASADRSGAREYWQIVVRTGRWSGELNFQNFGAGNTVPFLVNWFRIDDPRTRRPLNIAMVGRDLTVSKRAETHLRHLNETLEHRVSKRARELLVANTRLRNEINERERADARLQQLQRELSHAGRLSTAGQMAAALAHEINQPLTAVTNSVNAVRRLLSNRGCERISTVREIMGEAAEQALRVGQIIRRLREFVTRAETEKRNESVPAMIEEASAFAQAGSGILGVQVEIDFDPNASVVFVNRIQVQQVLTNLIRNALEAMATSQQRRLGLSTQLLDDGMIEISVKDSGSGISAEVVSQLFEPFVSTKLEGMGLGLSICRSIVVAHGGELRSEPNPVGGTIFRFTLPTVGGAGDDE
jgi:PAS domain S-box-containing protein